MLIFKIAFFCLSNLALLQLQLCTRILHLLKNLFTIKTICTFEKGGGAHFYVLLLTLIRFVYFLFLFCCLAFFFVGVILCMYYVDFARVHFIYHLSFFICFFFLFLCSLLFCYICVGVAGVLRFKFFVSLNVFSL